MKTILIVDDEPEITELLGVILSKKGYSVVRAVDGAQAVMQAMKSKPDLIILDIMMPAGSGITVYTRLKQSVLTQGIPIIILTAMIIENVKGKLPPGQDPIILAKPWEEQTLFSAIESLLGPPSA